jgi:transcriptional regulator with XRE-family HTH domain
MKNLINKRLRELRQEHGMSQNGLAQMLQLKGCDVDKNIINRIENDKRHVTDMELKAFVDIFGVDYGYLVEGRTEDRTKKEELQ